MTANPRAGNELSVCVSQSSHRPREEAAQLEGARWRKSSFSAAGECVLVAMIGDQGRSGRRSRMLSLIARSSLGTPEALEIRSRTDTDVVDIILGVEGRASEGVDSEEGEVALRLSNAPEAATLVMSRATMAAWIAGCKAGEFDDLI